MAITVDSAVAGQFTGASAVAQLAWNHTCHADCKLLIVGVDQGASQLPGQISSVTYNGVPMTQIGYAQNAGNMSCVLFGLANPDTGAAYAVNVNFSPNTAWVAASSISFLGASGEWGTSAGAGTLGGTASVNVGSVAGELVVDLCRAARGITADGSQAVHIDRGVTAPYEEGISTKAGAASVTMSWALSESNHWAIVGVSLKIPVEAKPRSQGFVL